jgi:hypothetical protein
MNRFETIMAAESAKSMCLMLFLWFCAVSAHRSTWNASHIVIFHIIDNSLWGETDGSYLQGIFPCEDYQLHCQLISSNPIIHNHSSSPRDSVTLKYPLHPRKPETNIVTESPFTIILDKFALHEQEQSIRGSRSLSSRPPITAALYNIHTWKTVAYSPYKPDILNLPTDYQIVESEESFGRFGHLFHRSFRFFDANSTTSPHATIQRTYMPHFNTSDFLPYREHASLIPAAAYVASTCHERRIMDGLSRDQIVDQLRSYGLRVDGLGSCRHTPPSSSSSNHSQAPITLRRGVNEKESLQLKQQALSQYMFYLAFENTIEAGYVTEKVVDGLYAGTLPIYLGATADLKVMLPIDDAIIYVDDFPRTNRWQALADYLRSLIENSHVYEKHRQWRKSFQVSYLSPLLRKSWPCRLCEWIHLRALRP